jgi:hypothetical protein
MNLNLSYQYVSIIFELLKEKYVQLEAINKYKTRKKEAETRIKLHSDRPIYSANIINKKKINAKNIINSCNEEIDDLNKYIENI